MGKTVSSSVNPCGHVQIEGTVLIATLPDPKRIRGRVFRDKVGDPVGCVYCDQVYPETIRPTDDSSVSRP